MVDYHSPAPRDIIDELKKKIKLKNINYKKALSGFMVVTILALGYTGYKVNEINTRAFEVYLGEDSLGVVRSEEEALNIMDDIRKDLSNTYSAECVLDQELTFQATHAKDDELIEASMLKSEINKNIDFLVAGYSIKIDGKVIGNLKTQEEAQEIIDSIKEPYITIEEGILKDVKIVEDLKIEKAEIQINDIGKQEDLFQYIKIGEDEIKTHIIEAGESFWTVARMYDTTVDNLMAANPDADPQNLWPGDEVKLLVPTSLLTVATTVEMEYDAETDYETIVEKDASMYTNQQKIKVEGQKGTSHIVSNVIKHNGILIEEKIITEEVIKEPVNEVVIKGTKELPKTAATGIFAMPTRGRFTSGYGYRWGRMHRGIDIAASVGTPIKAADGGKVTEAGWAGTYGYMVEIDHGNGFKTRYAHASKLLVKVGDKVYKGQHIANVGNTGRSTGAHLHLEVLKNGVHVNPSKYVK